MKVKVKHVPKFSIEMGRKLERQQGNQSGLSHYVLYRGMRIGNPLIVSSALDVEKWLTANFSSLL